MCSFRFPFQVVVAAHCWFAAALEMRVLRQPLVDVIGRSATGLRIGESNYGANLSPPLATAALDPGADSLMKAIDQLLREDASVASKEPQFSQQLPPHPEQQQQPQPKLQESVAPSLQVDSVLAAALSLTPKSLFSLVAGFPTSIPSVADAVSTFGFGDQQHADESLAITTAAPLTGGVVWKEILACAISSLIGALAALGLCFLPCFFAREKDPASRSFIMWTLHQVYVHIFELVTLLALAAVLVIMWWSGYIEIILGGSLTSLLLVLILIIVFSWMSRRSVLQMKHQLDNIKDSIKVLGLDVRGFERVPGTPRGLAATSKDHGCHSQ